MKDAQTTLTIYMMMVVALATTVNTILAPILAGRRDRRLAAGTKAVAEKAAEVATAVVEVKNELNVSKEEVATHRQDEKEAFSTLLSKVDATHKIVNSKETRMMQKLAEAQKVNLLLAQGMLEANPESLKLKQAVATAEALYNESVQDLQRKESELP